MRYDKFTEASEKLDSPNFSTATKTMSYISCQVCLLSRVDAAGKCRLVNIVKIMDVISTIITLYIQNEALRCIVQQQKWHFSTRNERTSFMWLVLWSSNISTKMQFTKLMLLWELLGLCSIARRNSSSLKRILFLWIVSLRQFWINAMKSLLSFPN